MSKIEIDFNTLKYNLYQILNVPSNADDTKIKKSFMKIIKTFHPDKNSELEEDIYYHIILSNQILLNKISRKKYDEYLLDKVENFTELKESFNKINLEQYFPKKNISNECFNNKINELNKKHGYTEDISSIPIMERFNKMKDQRSKIEIEKVEFSNIEDFNKKFNFYKSDGKFKTQIIEVKDGQNTSTELSTYTMGENYTKLGDLDKLYVEDSTHNSKYSSLDRAFLLLPNIENDLLIKTPEEKIKEYQNQTVKLKI